MLPRCPHRISKTHGFTLIELLVVVFIIAIMGVTSYDMLGSSMRLESRTAERSRAVEQITRAFHWLQQDAEQFVDRPVRDELGESLPSLRLQNGQLSLTHLGWDNPLQTQRSNAQRVSYQLIDGELRRLSWQVLDRAQDSKPIVQTLSEQGEWDISALEFSILSHTNGETEWQTEWPLKASNLPNDEHHAQAIAVRVSVTSKQFGTLERVFELPSRLTESIQ